MCCSRCVSVTLGLRGWMLAAVAVASPLALLYLSPTGMDTTYDWGLVRCVFGFALGVVCCRIHRRLRLRQPASVATATALECLVVAAVVMFVSAADKSATGRCSPRSCLRRRSWCSLPRRAWSAGCFRTRPLKWLGLLSYSIYLTHYFVVTVVPPVVKRVLHVDLWTPMPAGGGEYVMAYGRNDLEGTLWYVAVVALTLAFSAFTYRWIETPGRDWSRRWAGRPAAPQGAAEPVRSGQVPNP